MSSANGELVGDVDSFECHAIWTINNYSSIHNSKYPMDYVISPCFSLGDMEYKWMLRLYPKGCNSPGHMSVYLSNRSRVNIEATARFALVTGTNELRNIKPLSTATYQNISVQNNGKGLGKYLTIEDLFDRRAELLEDDELKIHVELANIFVSNPKENDLKFQEQQPPGSEQTAS